MSEPMNRMSNAPRSMECLDQFQAANWWMALVNRAVCAYKRRPEHYVVLQGAMASVWAWAAFGRNGSYRWITLVLACFVGPALCLALWKLLDRTLASRRAISRDAAARKVAFAFTGFTPLVFFMPEYLLSVQAVAHFTSCILLALVGVLFLVFLFGGIWRTDATESSLASDEDQRPISRRSRVFLVAFCGIYFGILTYLVLRKLFDFGFFIVGIDLAYIEQCFYTTLHGHFFYGNVLQDLLYAKTVTSDFAGHNSPIMLLLLPIYRLHEAVSTLLVVRNIFLAACAWPAYLVARQKLSTGPSVILAISYLLLPTVLYGMVDVFFPLSLAVFFLLFAFHFYFKRRFSYFFVFLVLLLSVREDMVFVVLAFGLLSLWEKLGRWWTWTPIALAVSWAGATWAVVLPHFLRGAPFVEDLAFEHLGRSRIEQIHNLLTHPAVYLMGHSSVLYLKQLATPLGLGVFGSLPITLFAIPYVGINLLAAKGGLFGLDWICGHYSLVPATVLFVGAVVGIGKVHTALPSQYLHRSLVRLTLPLLCLFVIVASWLFVFGSDQRNEFLARPWNPEARAVIQSIPAEARVAAPPYMLALLANRTGLYASNRALHYHSFDPTYVITETAWTSKNFGTESGAGLDTVQGGYGGISAKERRDYRQLLDEWVSQRPCEETYRGLYYIVYHCH